MVRACACVSRSIFLPLSLSRSSVKAIARWTPLPTRAAPCPNIATVSRPETLIDLSQNYSAATRRKSLKKILNLETGFMRVKCAAARKGAWQKERAGYSTCHHHRLQRGLGDLLSIFFNDSFRVPYLLQRAKNWEVFPQRKRFETRSKCIMRRVTYTYLYEGGRRGAIERNFFSWNFLVFSFSSKKNHVFLVLARELAMKISSRCDNRAGESEKIQKRIATVRARGLRRTWHEGHASRVREVECTEIERRWERAARTMTQKIQTGRGEADSRNASFLRFLPYALNISLA